MSPIDRFLAEVARRNHDAGPEALSSALREMRAHLEESADELRASGVARADAEEQAVKAFGSATQLHRPSPVAQGLVWLTLVGVTALDACACLGLLAPAYSLQMLGLTDTLMALTGACAAVVGFIQPRGWFLKLGEGALAIAGVNVAVLALFVHVVPLRDGLVLSGTEASLDKQLSGYRTSLDRLERAEGFAASLPAPGEGLAYYPTQAGFPRAGDTMLADTIGLGDVVLRQGKPESATAKWAWLGQIRPEQRMLHQDRISSLSARPKSPVVQWARAGVLYLLTFSGAALLICILPGVAGWSLRTLARVVVAALRGRPRSGAAA